MVVCLGSHFRGPLREKGRGWDVIHNRTERPAATRKSALGDCHYNKSSLLLSVSHLPVLPPVFPVSHAVD